ncbi:hypothetical protein [Paenibacillus sp. NEAU-GSW1]|uniref:hypothetical protein n=1 Tax=Paenibacillus sp. NEAU-GSW1 TaxID=2682486 RepID=UPI0012E1E857|nr:hypothetical protein [Paenibacillus sp. NEAU-GSW1]MUT66077.1 hypothetical protein [Paenibacillus sp. NEAU-GSW1]
MSNMRRLFKMFIIAAIFASAGLFAYKAEGPRELHAPTAEMTNVTDNHHSVAARAHAAVHYPASLVPLLLSAVIAVISPSIIRFVPPLFLHAFIPQKMKHLFLMPVKFTSTFVN